MIGKNKREIVPQLNQHFADVHKRAPETNPMVYNAWDKSQVEANPVECDSFLGTGSFTFNSWIFPTEDYCIATITGDDYDMCKREETQEKFSLWLDQYFWGYYERPKKSKGSTEDVPLRVSVYTIADMLTTPNKIEDFLKQISNREVEFEHYHIPITEVRYTAAGGTDKRRKRNTVKKFEWLFFSMSLINLAKRNNSWVDFGTAARKSGNFKAFSRYLDMLYREHTPTHRPKRLVGFRDVNKKAQENDVAFWVWVLATTGNSHLYKRRKKRYESRIEFSPVWNRITKLNKKTYKITFDLHLNRDTATIKFSSTKISDQVKPQLYAVCDVLNYLLSKRDIRD